MRSGTRLVLLSLLVAAAAAVAFWSYASRREAQRPPTAVTVARELVAADNTVVGRLGGLRSFEPVSVGPAAGREGVVLVVARVAGARDSGRLEADLVERDGRWRVAEAVFVLSGGESLPLADP